MNEDAFNMSIRKLLKEVGVTSQRAIETAVRDALDAGKISGTETLGATVTLSIDAIGLEHRVDGDISLED